MKHFGILKPQTWKILLNTVGLFCVTLYAVSMFVYPWFVGSKNWEHVQSVWSNWQSLNAGMLAFISSVIALNMSIYNANEQRERNFIAARAFLPEALSELTSYCKSSSVLLLEAWEKVKDHETKSPLISALTDLPENYKEVFSKCISFAEPEVGSHLALILMKLQVHHSRMQSLVSEFNKDSNTLVMPQNIVSYLYCLAELQSLINRTFNFARGLEPLNYGLLRPEDYHQAYFNLDIDTEAIDDLSGFTTRAIDRHEE